jgi:microcystin-dependent protein
MKYKIILIIILIIILLFIYKNKNKETEYFTLTEVLQNMASVYEESDGTLSFQNLKATGDTFLKRVIVNSDFVVRNGLSNTGGGITNSGPGGITNTGGSITNRGRFINTGSARITESLEVLGDISGNLVGLKGMILMWSGSIASIPDGWKLCNGQNGTPDLRSRFVVGASTTGSVLDTGLTVKEFSPTGTKGGAETVALDTTQIPAHDHLYSMALSNNDGGPGSTPNPWSAKGNALPVVDKGTARDYGPYTLYTGVQGGGQPHQNMPPYYALAYIMKV